MVGSDHSRKSRKSKKPDPSRHGPRIPFPLNDVYRFVAVINSRMSHVSGWEKDHWANLRPIDVTWVDLGSDHQTYMIQARIKPQSWPQSSGVTLRFRRPVLERAWQVFKGGIHAPHIRLEDKPLIIRFDVRLVHNSLVIQLAPVGEPYQEALVKAFLAKDENKEGGFG